MPVRSRTTPSPVPRQTTCCGSPAVRTHSAVYRLKSSLSEGGESAPGTSVPHGPANLEEESVPGTSVPHCPANLEEKCVTGKSISHHPADPLLSGRSMLG